MDTTKLCKIILYSISGFSFLSKNQPNVSPNFMILSTFGETFSKCSAKSATPRRDAATAPCRKVLIYNIL